MGSFWSWQTRSRSTLTSKLFFVWNRRDLYLGSLEFALGLTKPGSSFCNACGCVHERHHHLDDSLFIAKASCQKINASHVQAWIGVVLWAIWPQMFQTMCFKKLSVSATKVFDLPRYYFDHLTLVSFVWHVWHVFSPEGACPGIETIS